MSIVAWLWLLTVERKLADVSLSFSETIAVFAASAAIASALGWLLLAKIFRSRSLARTLFAPLLAWGAVGAIAGWLAYAVLDYYWDAARQLPLLLMEFGAISGIAFGLLSVWAEGHLAGSVGPGALIGSGAGLSYALAAIILPLVRGTASVTGAEIRSVVGVSIFFVSLGAIGGGISALVVRRSRARQSRLQ